MKHAKKVGEADNKKEKDGIKSYEYYENEVIVDSKKYKAHIRVRNTDMGDKYYGHTISRDIDEIKIEPLAWNSDAEDATVHSINASSSDSIISQKNDFVNSQNNTEEETLTENNESDTKLFIESEDNYRKESK